ncbi:MAG TPA: DUF167 domain-containing protein [Candidatus Acidoferrales bacterium]|nr:DUF167 domain-containing protein [Candidatus Acidoferrales bacterium]
MALEIHERDGAVHFTVRVQPRASASEIVGEVQGALKIRVTAPATEGRANEALCRFLAARLKAPQSAVRIVRGEHSRTKQLEIRGVTAAQIRALAG